MQWFERLGVPASASRNQIKAAFRRKTKALHPDVAPERADEYRLVVEAYNLGLAATRRSVVARPGANLYATITVPLETSITGGVVELDTPLGARVTVRIAAGLQHGARMRVAGHGEAAQGGAPPGDLLLEVELGEHPAWLRDDPNVIASAHVTWLQAYRGDTVRIPTPWGDRWITLPAGSKEGDRLTLKGLGLRVPGAAPGDLRVILRLVPPVPGCRALEEALEVARFLG